MLRVVCNILVLSVFFSIINAHAVDRYRVNVKANHYQYNPYSSTSTYDIDVERTGLRRLNLGPPVEEQLRDVPIGGRLSQIYSARSQSQRDDAEANLLNAQAELLRFQLREAKKQSRQRRATSDEYAKQLLFLKLCNDDVETATTMYNIFDGDPKAFWETLKDVTRRANEIKAQGAKETLASVLGLNNRETQLAYRKIHDYAIKYKLDRERAILKFMTLNCGLTPAQGRIALKRMGY
jgi:hypothetical protein